MRFSLNHLKQCLHDIMYKDSATVSRAVATTEDWTGALRQQHNIIYGNLPCKLSQYKDFVDVVHEGETFKLISGTSFNYVTHKEISMRRRREAMQR